jgi:hypothetical protein
MRVSFIRRAPTSSVGRSRRLSETATRRSQNGSGRPAFSFRNTIEFASFDAEGQAEDRVAITEKLAN